MKTSHTIPAEPPFLPHSEPQACRCRVGRTARPLATAVLALTLTLGIAMPTMADYRETVWTDFDGVTVRATLIGCTDTHVLLEKNGVDHRVPLGLLSEASRAKVARLLDSPPARPAVPVACRPAISNRPVPPRVRPTAPPPVTRGSYRSVAGLSRDRHGMPVYPFSAASRIVRVTAYTSTESDHLIYGDLSALGTRLRCSGTYRSAAADWSVYPVGTVFRIKGSAQLYQIDDYGSAMVGTGTIDIYQPTMEAMRAWGRRNVAITVLRWGSLTRSAQILSRRTGSDHCRRMLERVVKARSLCAR